MVKRTVPAARGRRSVGGFYESLVGQGAVHVAGPERTVLVPSSYEIVHWTATADPRAALERLVLNGWASGSTVDVPPGVPVETLGFHPDLGEAAVGYEWPSAETERLIEVAEQQTGLCPTSFHGCYDAGQAVVPPP